MPGESLLQKAARRVGSDALFSALTQEEKAVLSSMWAAVARPEQIPKMLPTHSIWLYLAGRGSGKTRSGAEWCLDLVRRGYCRGALVARTAADVRDTLVEGEAGILTVAPPYLRPNYEPAKRRLSWREVVVSLPGTTTFSTGGARAFTYSGDEPDQLRGPSHDFAWADELAAWKKIDAAWSNLMFGLRLRTRFDSEPLCCVTTTPRPLRVIKELIRDSATLTTAGTTYDNRENLAPSFYNKIIKRYEGTRLGRQELLAEILDDNPNALFTREDIDKHRLASIEECPQLVRVVVGVDPAVTSGEDSADTGIVTVGIDEAEDYYILADDTCHKKPFGWAKQVMKAYCANKADVIVGEVNNGGDLIEAVISKIPKDGGWIDIDGEDAVYSKVHATRGKHLRAEPVSALAEQGRLHIVGRFPELEDQMVQWSDDLKEKSPDRLDAMVWAATFLMKESVPRISLI